MGPFSGSCPTKEAGQYQKTTPCLPVCLSNDTGLQGRLWWRSVKIGEWFCFLCLLRCLPQTLLPHTMMTHAGPSDHPSRCSGHFSLWRRVQDDKHRAYNNLLNLSEVCLQWRTPVPASKV